MNWQWLLNDILKLFKWYSNERKAVGSGHVRKDRAHRFFVRVVFVLFETRRFCKVERFVFPDLYNFSAYTPFAFTEQGVAMLSSVLHSTVAIKVNINIMRAFVSIRQYVLASDTKNQEIDELRQRIQELESQGSKAFAMINQIGEETLEAINDLSEDTRKELDSIYLALSELADKEKTESLKSKHRRPIGFIHYDNEE